MKKRIIIVGKGVKTRRETQRDIKEKLYHAVCSSIQLINKNDEQIFYDTFTFNTPFQENNTIAQTSGLENYDRLRPIVYKSATAIIYVFSYGDESSLDEIKTKWMPEVKHYLKNDKFPCFMVGVYEDTVSISPLLEEKAMKLASEHQIGFVSCNIDDTQKLDAIMIARSIIKYVEKNEFIFTLRPKFFKDFSVELTKPFIQKSRLVALGHYGSQKSSDFSKLPQDVIILILLYVGQDVTKNKDHLNIFVRFILQKADKKNTKQNELSYKNKNYQYSDLIELTFVSNLTAINNKIDNIPKDKNSRCNIS